MNAKVTLGAVGALVLLIAGLALAQIQRTPVFIPPDKLLTVRGELKIEGGGRPQDYTAEIEPCRRQLGSARASIAPSGQFEFRELVPDCYVVRILTGPQGKLLLQKTLQTGPDQSAVQFVLRREANAQPAAGYVSLRQLASPPPKEAVKAFERGQKEAQAGRLQKATEHYRQALKIHPDYAEAHCELGSIYLQEGQTEAARTELVAARNLGLESPEVLGPLALVLLQVGQVKESEETAHEALAKDPSNAQANYAYASSLLFHSTDYAQVLDYLSRAASQIPSARLLSAKVRAKSGDTQGAIVDLMEYLKVCPDDKRAAAAATLRELQAQPLAERH